MRAGSFQESRAVCAKALGQKCAACTQRIEQVNVAGVTWTKERCVGVLFGEGGRADCGGPSRLLESGFNLKYNGKPSGGFGMM